MMTIGRLALAAGVNVRVSACRAPGEHEHHARAALRPRSCGDRGRVGPSSQRRGKGRAAAHGHRNAESDDGV